MKITFAIPRKIDGVDYAPDESAEIGDDVAGQLLRDGYARRYTGDVEKPQVAEQDDPPGDPLPEPPPRSGRGSGVDNWVTYASAHGVVVPDGADREKVLEILTDAGVPTGAPDEDDDPDAGDDKEKE